MHLRVFTSQADDRWEAFRSALDEQCDVLGIRLTVSEGGPPNSGEVVVFIGNTAGVTLSSAENTALAAFVDAGGRVLPSLRNPEDAPMALPDTLGKINAFIEARYEDAWPQALVDELLSVAWLHRLKRRIFISYRRIDSAGVAHQLADRLSELGFQVFLDERSLEPSVDFQAELRAHLNDTDLVVLLASPRLEESRWVREEITFAQRASIGLLPVVWPQACFEQGQFAGEERAFPHPSVLDTASLIVPHEVPAEGWRGSFDSPSDMTLHDGALTDVIRAALRSRSVGIRQRLETLIDNAQVLVAPDLVPQDELGDLMAIDRSTFVRVLPYRPGPLDVHAAHEAGDGVGARRAGVYYAEPDGPQADVNALRWLVDSSPTSLWVDIGGKLAE